MLLIDEGPWPQYFLDSNHGLVYRYDSPYQTGPWLKHLVRPSSAWYWGTGSYLMAERWAKDVIMRGFNATTQAELMAQHGVTLSFFNHPGGPDAAD